MATSLWTGVLVSMVIGQCLCGCGLAYPADAKEKELSKKEMKEELGVLTNEVTELKEDVTQLQRKVGLSEHEMVRNISVVSASRRFLPDDQVCFTVQYKVFGNLRTSRSWMLYQDFTYTHISEHMSNEIHQLPLNVEQSSVILPAGNDTYAYFTFGTSREWAHLYLRNAWEGDLTETDIKLPLMEVSPDQEFVYKPGQNVTFQISTPKQLDKSKLDSTLPAEHFRAVYKLVRPGGDEVISQLDSELRDEFFTRTNLKNYLDKEQFDIQLNTANHPYMGIFHFATGASDPAAFVGTVKYLREFVLRPSTQPGAFPEGSLYASEYPWLEKNKDGQYEKHCRYGDPCYAHCEVLGDKVMSVKLYETVDGKTKRLQMVPMEGVDRDSYRLSGEYRINTDPPVLSPATYTCVGTNAWGRKVTWSLLQYIGPDVEFVQNETNMEDFQNGTALITCTATGQPLPNITISCDPVNGTDTEVLYQTDDVISVSKLCGVPSNLDALDMRPWIACEAENKFRNAYTVLRTDRMFEYMYGF